MNNKIQIFQYLSLVRYKGVLKIIKKLSKEKVAIILDFEDSSKDIFDAKNTLKLKKKCREGFEFLSTKKISYGNIFIRINSIKSKFFKNDIVCLKKSLNKGIKIKGIFLPKVDKYKDLKLLDNILKLKKNKIKLIPMIENRKGLNNLENILLLDKKKLIYGVHYGHFDFCLSGRVWPFPEPYHKEFWEIVFKIANNCIKYKVRFIQTPFPIINNPKLFYKSISYLKRNLPKLNLSLTLVNFDERFFKKNYILNDKLRVKKISNEINYNIKFAKKIMKTYLDTKKDKKSFSLSDKRFIPPHQYLVAKYFIKKNEKR